MLVAKLHKLGERLERPDRLQPKDAGDVYRLFDVVDPNEMADRIGILLGDVRSTQVAEQAIEYGTRLFGEAHPVGVELAQAALRGTLPKGTVASTVIAYWKALLAALS